MSGLLLEAILAVLMAATIGYCALVHWRIAQVRGLQSDLRAIVYELTDATGDAEAAIGRLSDAAGLAEIRFGAQLDRSRELENSLADAINAGEELAGRLAIVSAGAAAERPVLALGVTEARASRAS